jgi:type I restriction enzyme S subunit
MTNQTLALGDLYRIGSSKRVLKSQWKTEGVPFYRGREITRLAADGFVENELFISEEHFAELAAQSGVPNADDIVITAIGTIGNTHIVRESDRFYFKDASVLWMKRISDVSSQFINLWLKSPLFFDQLDKGNGATVDTLTIQKLQSVRLCVPPLPEQHRIVALLDETFDGIATAKANAEKNLQNARALFESHLQSVFTEAWQAGELVTLAELATDITDGDHMPPPKAPSGVPFITIGNVAKDVRRIDFADTFMVPREYFDALKPNKKPRVGDVLYTVTGSFGIPILVNEQRDFCFQRHIGLIRPKTDVSSEWLFYLLMSPQIAQQATAGATGTAQKTVSLKVLRGFKVPHIPLTMQKAATSTLSNLANETRRLESLYQRKLAALDELKQSLLHQAFNGNL